MDRRTVSIVVRDQPCDRLVPSVLEDWLRHWRKPDGAFKTRQSLLGWGNVPMHGWTQLRLLCSLCAFCLLQATAA